MIRFPLPQGRVWTLQGGFHTGFFHPGMYRIPEGLQLKISAVPPAELLGLGEPAGERSSTIAARVLKAREIQLERYAGENFYTNAQIPPGKLGEYCRIGDKEQEFLRNVISRLGISARGYGRILKISRTIADLDGEDFISLGHISKAIQFRVNINGI